MDNRCRLMLCAEQKSALNFVFCMQKSIQISNQVVKLFFECGSTVFGKLLLKNLYFFVRIRTLVQDKSLAGLVDIQQAIFSLVDFNLLLIRAGNLR
jgi:hypothetical protein